MLRRLKTMKKCQFNLGKWDGLVTFANLLYYIVNPILIVDMLMHCGGQR